MNTTVAFDVETYTKAARFTVPRKYRAALGLPKSGDVDVHLTISLNGRVIFSGDVQLKSGSEVYGEQIRQSGVKAGNQSLRIEMTLSGHKE